MHSGLLRDYECEEPVLEIFSDADWAADRNTRRSVSGGAIFYGGCLVYSSSRTRKIVSLSSAESETYAAASFSCHGCHPHQNHSLLGTSSTHSDTCTLIHQLRGEFFHEKGLDI